ncbi:AfsR/SARP family transcriptional regulator [Rathayibacter sp. YIM 133350]|uniref:AfsR/SARP family transcriptional regulator n=1 Tax=Rathayibacter sp. YIM 133350 TaxID=3131992 RepID=UPI00307F9C2B
MIGAMGSGKSALLQQFAASAGVEPLRLGPQHSSPAALAATLQRLPMTTSDTVIIDDAGWAIGTEAESVLEGLISEAPGRVIIASRTTPRHGVNHSELGSTEVIDVRALALRLPEIVGAVRAATGQAIGLECASRVLTETGGWPALVGLVARAVRGVDADGMDSAIDAAIFGDVATPFFDALLEELDPTVRDALEHSCLTPAIDPETCASLLGGERARALIAALDSGQLVNRLGRGQLRVLPRMLQRHVARHLNASARTRRAIETSSALLTAGDVRGATAALASAAAWVPLAEQLNSTPELMLSPGSCPWALHLSPAVSRHESIALAQVRALIDDRALVDAREALTHVDLADLSHVAAQLSIELEPATPPARRHLPGARLTPDGTFAAAVGRLRLGDVVGAVPLLQRAVHARSATASVCISARLTLIVLRAATAPRPATMTALCLLERDALENGLSGLARLVRGAIAAHLNDADASAVAGVVSECEAAADDDGAAIVSAMHLLVRLREGRAPLAHAVELADRFTRGHRTDAAAWVQAVAALIAAEHASPHARALLTSAESAAITAGIPAIHVFLDAARAFLHPEEAARRLLTARRTAREVGLPRIPGSLPAPPRANAGAAQTTLRLPRMTIGCFGGFRLTIDGTDLDLRGVRPQARTLLRMLALNAGSPVHREIIADLLWGDLGTSSAVHALHVSISSLRRALGADASVPMVERAGEAYQLRLANRRDCDLIDFDASLADAGVAKARGEAQLTAEGLRHAVGLYVGEVLPEDGPAEWAIGARDRYRTRAAEAAASLAQLELHFGDRRAAVAAAERSVEIDPWLDESWRTLVAVHQTSGDVVASRRAQQGYRRMRVALGV